MGRPIAAEVFADDGTVTVVEDLDDLDVHEAAGRIALRYDYGPSLLEFPVDDGMWRYRPLLPLGDEPVRYPLAVGATPLVAAWRLREHLGVPFLWLKDETRGPTGSNKDRATALVAEQALRAGVCTLSCASTGNVAASLAVGAAAAGLRAVVFVPSDADPSKLTLMLLAEATVIKVRAGYARAFELSRTMAAQQGWLDRNTGVNPSTLEAKKTVAFEIWEQLGRQAPDVVVVPVGDGPTLSACAKGFRELRACGAITTVPRLVGVQAEGCQPLKVAWERGEPVRPVEPVTIADGIAVGDPISASMTLRDVRESDGAFVAVSDERLRAAIRTLLAYAGVVAEPAGAAALAGLQQALAAGLVSATDRTVVLVTGTGLKTPRYLKTNREPLEISGAPEELVAHLAADVVGDTPA